MSEEEVLLHLSKLAETLPDSAFGVAQWDKKPKRHRMTVSEKPEITVDALPDRSAGASVLIRHNGKAVYPPSDRAIAASLCLLIIARYDGKVEAIEKKKVADFLRDLTAVPVPATS